MESVRRSRSLMYALRRCSKSSNIVSVGFAGLSDSASLHAVAAPSAAHTYATITIWVARRLVDTGLLPSEHGDRRHPGDALLNESFKGRAAFHSLFPRGRRRRIPLR